MPCAFLPWPPFSFQTLYRTHGETWKSAQYFWGVNLGLWETPAPLEGGPSAWVFPLKGKKMASSGLFLFLVVQRPLSYTTLDITWVILGFTGSGLAGGRTLWTMAFYLRKYSIHFIPLGQVKLLVSVSGYDIAKGIFFIFLFFLLLPWNCFSRQSLRFVYGMPMWRNRQSV